MDSTDASSAETSPPRGRARGTGLTLSASTSAAGLDRRQTGEILGEWQPRELRVCQAFPECSGLSYQQLEDIYQDTCLALYSRAHKDEEHLRRALHAGIKQRAIRAHRDERRRLRVLVREAPGLRRVAETSASPTAPEPALLANEDRLLAREFLAELSDNERRVFAALVEGLQYRAIATALNMPPNQARNLTRACARKRERWQLLYDTGRLCGYRAQTIRALKAGQRTSADLAERAFAHLESCAQCRLDHKTNAMRLRESMRKQAAALLPPVLLGHTGRLTRLGMRARLLTARLGLGGAPVEQGSTRERVAALIAGSGAATKVAAGVVAVGVLASGAAVSHVLNGPPRATHDHHQVAGAAQANASSQPPTAKAVSLGTTSQPAHRHRASRPTGLLRPRSPVLPPMMRAPLAPTPLPSNTSPRHAPGGPGDSSVPVRQASLQKAPPAKGAVEDQRNGGPFSP